MINSRKYHGKLLLLGEYTTVLGGEALAIPVNQYYGEWSKSGDSQLKDAQEGRKSLYGLYEYARDVLNFEVKEQLFESDFNENLQFASNIPFGYGLGSSGALTAAFYDRYIVKSTESLADIKRKLGELESHFHGKSSGMDPLISFVNYPILNHGENQLEILMNEIDFNALDFSLIDSGNSRSTTPLVQSFLRKLDSDMEFKKKMSELGSLNKDAIQALLSNDLDHFADQVNRISFLQYKRLHELVHATVKAEWQASLKDDKTAIKLCGAGGGGCYLRFRF